jgi:Protein of unknown function (DUF2716)
MRRVPSPRTIEGPSPPSWKPLPERYEDRVMRLFQSRFKFHPDVTASAWPSIDEPRPSLTLDLSSVSTPHGSSIPHADETILGFFLSAFPASTRLVAINVNHYAHWFWPHRFAVAQRQWPDAWAVHPFPNGDYSIFLTEEMSQGTFGHPWEKTLCLFGQALLNVVPMADSPWPVKRRS